MDIDSVHTSAVGLPIGPGPTASVTLPPTLRRFCLHGKVAVVTGYVARSLFSYITYKLIQTQRGPWFGILHVRSSL